MDLDGYLVNIHKGYVLRRKVIFSLIKEYKLNSMKGQDGHYYILFADVYKEFIKKAFEYHKVNKFKVES